MTASMPLPLAALVVCLIFTAVIVHSVPPALRAPVLGGLAAVLTAAAAVVAATAT